MRGFPWEPEDTVLEGALPCKLSGVRSAPGTAWPCCICAGTGIQRVSAKTGPRGRRPSEGANSSVQIPPTNDMMGGRNTLTHYNNEAYLITVFLGGNSHRGQKPLKCLFPLTQDLPFISFNPGYTISRNCPMRLKTDMLKIDT